MHWDSCCSHFSPADDDANAMTRNDLRRVRAGRGRGRRATCGRPPARPPRGPCTARACPSCVSAREHAARKPNLNRRRMGHSIGAQHLISMPRRVITKGVWQFGALSSEIYRGMGSGWGGGGAMKAETGMGLVLPGVLTCSPSECWMRGFRVFALESLGGTFVHCPS